MPAQTAPAASRRDPKGRPAQRGPATISRKQARFERRLTLRRIARGEVTVESLTPAPAAAPDTRSLDSKINEMLNTRHLRRR